MLFLTRLWAGGGVLLEAILHGNAAVGLDINPLAVLISRAKTTPISRDLRPTLERILERSAADARRRKSYPELVPGGYAVSEWFNPRTLRALTVLKKHVFDIEDKHVADFFKVCFSLTVRRSSYQRNGAWKTHRIPEADRARARPDPIGILESVSSENISRMIALVRAGPTGTAHPMLGDTRTLGARLAGAADLPNGGRADLVVTSPPYGDHKTTVAYGQFSRHPGHWLDLPEEQVRGVDKAGLGGRAYGDMDDLGSGTLNATLDSIRRNDVRLSRGKAARRDRDTYAFFVDLDTCMGQISQNMARRGARACFVVANRTVRRVTVPTDKILEELGRKHGFMKESIIRRDIPNKAMPSRNAPENVAKETGSTMTRETVVIMRR